MRLIGKAAHWIAGLLPAKKYIVFESVPDLSDNTKAVYDEMIHQGLHHKYKMLWLVRGRKENLPVLPNTFYIRQDTWLTQKICKWVTLRAKCLICCNAFLETQTPSQTSFYLTHGTALKKLNAYVLPENVSYTVVASEHTKPVMVKELCGDISTFHALGYPRNDVFHQPQLDLHSVLEGDFQKVVVWYPTFRQHKNGLRTASANALPVLHETETAMHLNEIARENDILIVIKPHFAQDVSYIKDYCLSNIRFIDDSFFAQHKTTSYAFVGSCDALITDYSSIYFDYLLCDKPVAVIWEDIDDYRKNPGFAMEPEYYMKGAQKIYHLADFERFLRDLKDGNDVLKNERSEINQLVNYSSDGKNSERVVDFIREKAKL